MTKAWRTYFTTLFAMGIGWTAVACIATWLMERPLSLVPQNFTGWAGVTALITGSTVRLVSNLRRERLNG